jgi:hypothetical protein
VTTANKQPTADLTPDGVAGNPRQEVTGCPTGLGEHPNDKTEVQEPPTVEKLEGRQEGGRDAEDEK